MYIYLRRECVECPQASEPSAEGEPTQAEAIHCQHMRKPDLHKKSTRRTADQSSSSCEEDEGLAQSGDGGWATFTCDKQTT